MKKRLGTDTTTGRKTRTAYLLAKAHFAMRVEVDATLSPLGITGIQYTVLSLVSRHPGLSSVGLARRFYRTQQAMGQLLIGLEDKGWLIRSEYPPNRRMLMVTLTEAGNALVAAGEVALNKVEAATFSGFSDAEMDVFHRMLEHIDHRVTPRQDASTAPRRAATTQAQTAVRRTKELP